jgi:Uma2 family endonuclease
MAIPERIYTADDLWELSHSSEYEGKRLELSEGELIEMAPSGGKHGGIAIRYGRFVDEYVEDNALGYTTAAETGYILFKNPTGKDTVRAPDVGFVAAHRLPDGLPDGFVPLAPDLAVEVVSPTDSADDIQSKLNDYLKYGVRMTVFVYPKSKTVNVHTPGKTIILTIDDTLDGADVLPGFKLAVRDIFPV